MSSGSAPAFSPPDGQHCRVLAIDPGRDKCGLAVVDFFCGGATVRKRCIVGPLEVPATATHLSQLYEITQLLLGDSTTSQRLAENLRQALPQMELHMVNEKGSTLAARTLYWAAHPPRGWRRMLPLSLQEPPEPVDDFAAVVLARRFFGVE